MKRRAYDEERIKKLSLAAVNEAHPDWTIERMREVAQTDEYRNDIIRQLIAMDMAHRIQEDMEGYWSYIDCFYEAQYIMHNIQSELIPNINEWLDGNPLSDIKVNGISILDIKSQFKNVNIPMLHILRCMIHWKENEYKNPDFCRAYLASM